MRVQCKQCGADLAENTFAEGSLRSTKNLVLKVTPCQICAQQNVQRNGLTPSQKEEVQQMIMSALATGSV